MCTWKFRLFNSFSPILSHLFFRYAYSHCTDQELGSMKNGRLGCVSSDDPGTGHLECQPPLAQSKDLSTEAASGLSSMWDAQL